MAPRAPAKRKPSTITEDTTSTQSTTHSPALKPKTEKAKVEKSKGGAAEKLKASKKVERAIPTATNVAAAATTGGKDSKKKLGTGEYGKSKPVSGDEAEKLILQYLKEQNRPYSATEVSANLHGKVCFRPPLCL